MTDRLIAIAALVGALANFGAFLIHCRRDKRVERELRGK
jgi:hypothetical protein